MKFTQQQFRSFNEEMSRKYGPDKYYRTKVSFIRFAEKIKLRKIKAAMKNIHPDILLDIGCGPCNIANKISAAQKIGLDLSAYQLQFATAGIEEIHLIQADAEQLPLKDNYFSHILLTDVIEHVLNPALVIQELFRISKRNAVVILNVPNDLYIQKWKSILINLSLQYFFMPEYYPENRNHNLNNLWHLHVFSLNDLECLLAKYFRIEELHYIPCKLMPFQHLLVLSPRK